VLEVEGVVLEEEVYVVLELDIVVVDEEVEEEVYEDED
jgi:hypothetical protein